MSSHHSQLTNVFACQRSDRQTGWRKKSIARNTACQYRYEFDSWRTRWQFHFKFIDVNHFKSNCDWMFACDFVLKSDCCQRLHQMKSTFAKADGVHQTGNPFKVILDACVTQNLMDFFFCSSISSPATFEIRTRIRKIIVAIGPFVCSDCRRTSSVQHCSWSWHFLRRWSDEETPSIYKLFALFDHFIGVNAKCHCNNSRRFNAISFAHPTVIMNTKRNNFGASVNLKWKWEIFSRPQNQ